MNQPSLLVPYDFTSVSESALKNALIITKHTKATIVLLHLVKSSKKIPHATKKLQEIIDSLNETNINIIPRVEKGNIFDDIGKVAEEAKSSIIVMGTHGAKGMQKLLGSFAIKVVTSTSVPFMIVQDNSIARNLKKIVLPVTASKESLQILPATANLARVLSAEVEVVFETKGEAPLQRRIQNYAKIALQQLEEHGVEDSKAYQLKDEGNYQEQIINFCKKSDVGLIAVAYYTETIFSQFDTFAQDLITNKDNIPTLIIKTVDSTVGYF